jgi:hypothetical protein
MRRYLFVFLALLCIAQLALSLIQRSYSREPLAVPIATTERIISDEDRRSGVTNPTEEESRILLASSIGASLDSKVLPPAAQDATVRRDPFAPFFRVTGRDVSESSVALTDVDLKDIRVTAILHTATGKASASVETAAGRAFIISQGSPIGTKGGRVSDISAARVVISEPASRDAITGSAPELITVLTLRDDRK